MLKINVDYFHSYGILKLPSEANIVAQQYEQTYFFYEGAGGSCLVYVATGLYARRKEIGHKTNFME